MAIHLEIRLYAKQPSRGTSIFVWTSVGSKIQRQISEEKQKD